MPLPAIFEKRESAIKDYSVIWTDWLNPTEIVQVSSWAMPAGGVTDSVGDGGQINVTPAELNGVEYRAQTVTTIWLAGGTVGERYEIENTITTSEGRVETRSLFIQMVDNYNP